MPFVAICTYIYIFIYRNRHTILYIYIYIYRSRHTIPQFAIVSLMCPPEWVILQHLILLKVCSHTPALVVRQCMAILYKKYYTQMIFLTLTYHYRVETVPLCIADKEIPEQIIYSYIYKSKKHTFTIHKWYFFSHINISLQSRNEAIMYSGQRIIQLHMYTNQNILWKRVLIRGIPRSQESSKSSNVKRRFCCAASCRLSAYSAHTRWESINSLSQG